MKRTKRIICLVLAVLMATALLGGCTKGKSTSNDEDVTLTWMFGGAGKLADSERVWGLFNEKLQDYLPGTKVEFKCIPLADYAEKWRLTAASSEKVDIAWVSYDMNFIEEVSKDAYLDITELIDEYGQDMKAEFPDWLLDLTTVDGKIYAIPNYQMMVNPTGFAVEKYHIDNGWLDIEKAEEVLNLDRPWKKEDFKVFEDYFQTMLEQNEKVKYVSSGFMNRTIKHIGEPVEGLETIICNAVVKTGDESCKVYNLLTDFPEMYDFYDLSYEWYQKGIIRPDILENPTEKEGDYLLGWTSLLKGAKEREEAKRGIPMEIIETRSKPIIGHKGSSTNTALPASCQHPEKAMQLLNLMNSSKGTELLNLLTYGIEGEHYNKISDDRIEWLGEKSVGASNNKYGYYNWILGNALLTYTTQTDPEGWNEYIDQEVNREASVSLLRGFTLDQDPIKLEIAQYKAVMQEYSYLEKGVIIPDYKEKLQERNEKLVAAGSEKIVAEVQRQVQAWLKTK